MQPGFADLLAQPRDLGHDLSAAAGQIGHRGLVAQHEGLGRKALLVELPIAVELFLGQPLAFDNRIQLGLHPLHLRLLLLDPLSQYGGLACVQLLSRGEEELLITDHLRYAGVSGACHHVSRKRQRRGTGRFRREARTLGDHGVVLVLKHVNGGARLDIVEQQKRLTGPDRLSFLDQDLFDDPALTVTQRLAHRIRAHLSRPGDTGGQLVDRRPGTQADDEHADKDGAEHHGAFEPALQF